LLVNAVPPAPCSWLCSTFFVQRPADHRDLHSFPTRRSSDLSADVVAYLKTKKMDVIAYESLAEAISTTPACRERAADLLSGLACACADDDATQRFVRGDDGVWVFQP